MDRTAQDEALQNAARLALDILGRASAALERLGDEDTRGLVRCAEIELKAALDAEDA